MNNNLSQWIKFFLTGIIETATKGVATFQNILKLREEIESNKIISLGKKLPLAKKVLNYLYKNPIIHSNYLVDEMGISKPTANAIINDFIKLNILKEVSGQIRNKLFVFDEYLNLFKK